MSQENLDLARRLYAAWNRGAVEEATAALASDVEWHGHPWLPEPGPYRNRDQVARWMVQFREAWGELEAEPVELIESGESIVALVRMSGRGRGSGVEVHGGADVHIITFRDGAVIYFRIHPGDFLLEHSEISDAEFELLTLRVRERLEVAEIAERLGIEEADARAMLEHARTVMRELPGSERVV